MPIGFQIATMDSHFVTTNQAGSPEGRAALIALASTLGVETATLKPILEIAFSMVERGITPGIALQVTFSRLGYSFDSIKFYNILEAFRRAFAGIFAQSSGKQQYLSWKLGSVYTNSKYRCHHERVYSTNATYLFDSAHAVHQRYSTCACPRFERQPPSYHSGHTASTDSWRLYP